MQQVFIYGKEAIRTVYSFSPVGHSELRYIPSGEVVLLALNTDS